MILEFHLLNKKLLLDDYSNEEVKENFLKNPNLLIFGEVISSQAEFDEMTESGKVKQHVTVYMDENPGELMKEFKSDAEWEKFFVDNEIADEVQFSKTRYIYQ
jgi:hypothetical protein